jgi:RNA polymerase sigma factor FliA
MIASEVGECRTQLPSHSRNELILEHLPQVKLIARRIHRGLPNSVPLDDLISTGIVGLIAAIDRYDPNQHVKLRTYAEYKIRGAILDSLRTLDWAPRQQRKRARLIEAAIATLEQEHRRTPEEEEISQQLDLSIAEYQDWLCKTRRLTVGSLESSGLEEDGYDLLRYISDSEDQWPSELLERSELQRLLAEAIETIPSIERTVLSLYFYEEMTLRDISKIIELHESRVSQLKSQAIMRLRTVFSRSWPRERSSCAGTRDYSPNVTERVRAR